MYTMRLTSLVLGAIAVLGFAGSATAQAEPSLDDTVRYLNSYLHENEDHLDRTGSVLVFDHAPKCAYDSKLPLLDLSRDITLYVPGDGRVLATLRCMSGACIRRFSDCDHRANAAVSEITIAFRAEKKASVERAFAHLFSILPDPAADPF